MQLVELSSLSAVLGVLTALIAPALLISACGNLITSTTHRLISNTERFRTLAVRIRRLDGQKGLPSMAERRELDAQLDWTYRRVLIQQRALTLFYTAAVFFVACSFALGLEAVTRALPSWLPVFLGLFGVLVLLVAVALLLVETHRLVAGMREELSALHEEVRRGSRPEPADMTA
jgi:hypothetical protein